MKIAIQLREVFKYSLANFSEDKKKNKITDNNQDILTLEWGGGRTC